MPFYFTFPGLISDREDEFKEFYQNLVRELLIGILPQRRLIVQLLLEDAVAVETTARLQTMPLTTALILFRVLKHQFCKCLQK